MSGMIGISLGDVTGVGPEVTLKAIAAELPADVHEASCGYCLPHAGTFALLDSVSAEVLRALPRCNGRVAVTGFCLGGAMAIASVGSGTVQSHLDAVSALVLGSGDEASFLGEGDVTSETRLLAEYTTRTIGLYGTTGFKLRGSAVGGHVAAQETAKAGPVRV
mgnify:CR=1 FL=1